MGFAMRTWLAAGMALFVAPDHLRMWGNLAGSMGPGFWFVVLGAAGIYSLTVLGYRRLARSAAHSGGYLGALRRQFGWGAVSLVLASRLALTVGLSTGLLVTAGFVFNETFLYWFPNFGFAFLCLAIVLLIELGGYGLAEKAQLALLGVAVLGLILLITTGIWIRAASAAAVPMTSSGFEWPVMFSGLLLFVGFDLGIHSSDHARGTDPVAMLMVLGVAVIILGLWGTVSQTFVAPDRLAESFIPYTLAAREIGGQSGRIVMGMVLIAGTLCAVSALFSATSRLAASLARLEMLPAWCRGSERRNIAPPIVLGVVIAAMMAGGLAGTPKLEGLIRAGFLLWLLNAAMVHWAASRIFGGESHGEMPLRRPKAAWFNIAAGFILCGATVHLMITGTQRLPVLVYLLTGWAGILLTLWFVRRADRLWRHL